MLKFVRRLIASAAAGAAMIPGSQAAPPTAEPLIEVDRDSEERLIVEHPMAANAVRAEYLANYSGEKTFMSDDLRARVMASRRFRNPVVDLAGAREEFERFVQERTK